MIAPYQVFKAGDGRMVIGAGNRKARGIGTPLTMDGKAEANVSPAQAVGQHSREVLGDFGFTGAEIDSLLAGGVVHQG